MRHIILTDTHAGCRDDNQPIMNHQRKVWDYVINFAKDFGINHFYHLGDFFDNRKRISLKTMEFVTHLTTKLSENDITVTLIIGNHDTAYKNTNEVNSPEYLLSGEIFDIDSQDVTEVGDVLLVNWITKDNYETVVDKIEKSKSKYCFGHFDIAGFKFQRNGIESSSALKQSTFMKFDKVLSGHFHTHQIVGNIEYIGSPFEMSWADYNDPKGFIVFDDEAGTFEFVEHGINLYHVLEISDAGKTMTPPTKDIDGKFIRLVSSLDEKITLKAAQMLVDKGAHQVMVIYDNVATVATKSEVNLNKSSEEIAADYIKSQYADEDFAAAVNKKANEYIKDVVHGV